MSEDSKPGHTSVYSRGGLVLILLEGSPRLAFFLKFYLPAVLIGYCGLIALADWLNLPGLNTWLALWSPLVDTLRQILPVFDNSERALAAAGYAHRIPIILHLIAVQWLLLVPALLFSVIAIFQVPRSDWVRMASCWSRYRFAFVTLWMLILFGGLLWIVAFVIGNVGGNPLYAQHRSNLALLGIGVTFYVVILLGVSTVVSARALFCSRSAEMKR